MDRRLEELEDQLRISWQPHSASDVAAALHPWVRFFAIHTRFPISMLVIGLGGAIMWTVLLIATWLIHFGAV